MSAQIAVLGLLVERPLHGYGIAQLIEQRGMRSWTSIGFSSTDAAATAERCGSRRSGAGAVCGTTTEPADTRQQLLAGPTAQEEAAGLRTAIPASSVVRQVSVAEGVATVDVSPEFAGVGGQEEIMAIAQLVLTLTARGVERVTIHLEGLPVALPLPNGVLVTDPVGFDDYQVLIDR